MREGFATERQACTERRGRACWFPAGVTGAYPISGGSQRKWIPAQVDSSTGGSQHRWIPDSNLIESTRWEQRRCYLAGFSGAGVWLAAAALLSGWLQCCDERVRVAVAYRRRWESEDCIVDETQKNRRQRETERGPGGDRGVAEGMSVPQESGNN